MTEQVRLQVTYDPSNINSNMAVTMVKDDYPSSLGSINYKNLFNFRADREIGLLPPVTKYVSPQIGEYTYVLVERKPMSMRLNDQTSVPVPWNYFLIALPANGNKGPDDTKSVKVCWLFRDDQLYLNKETLSASWLTRKTFAQCDDDIGKYIEANNIYHGSPDALLAIVSILNKNYFWSDIDVNSFGLKNYAKVMDVKPESFLTDMGERSINDILHADMWSEFNINQLHTYAVKQAVDSIPTLSEKMIHDAYS